MADRRKVWAICDEDEILVVVDATHWPKDKDLPPQVDWEEFFTCPVCGNSLGMADEDPTSIYEDQDFHRRSAGKRTIMNLLEFMSKGELLTGLQKACEYYEIDPANHGVEFVAAQDGY